MISDTPSHKVGISALCRHPVSAQTFGELPVFFVGVDLLDFSHDGMTCKVEFVIGLRAIGTDAQTTARNAVMIAQFFKQSF